MNENNERNVYYLEELSNYKVSNSDKDVRGWEVKDKNGRAIGKVDNMLVNKSTERVVYLDVKVDNSIIDSNFKPYSNKASDGVHDFINQDGENHLIIPIGLTYINLDSKLVFSKDVDYETFAETKRIKKGSNIQREYEILVLDTYKRNDISEDHPEDNVFYERSEFKQH